MSKLSKLVKEVINEFVNESILNQQMEMQSYEFKSFIESYKEHVDSNSSINGVLTLAKENWDDQAGAPLAYVGYVDKDHVHFRYFPDSMKFIYDAEIIEKPFLFVHKGSSTSSGKVKED